VSAAQSWLIVGGMFSLLLSTLVAFALFWVRAREPQRPAPHFGLVSHKATLWNGFLLLGLSVAIEHTGFTPQINVILAITEVLATVLSNGRNILTWAEGVEDSFAQGTPASIRMRGLGNVLHLVVISGVFYGVTRTALGLW
jgi:hypothetical protein